MKIQFCGAAKTVTGSCYYVDTGSSKFLVDCGAFQGSDELENQNRDPLPFNPAELDVVFLTHAHFDHCGRLPMLVKQGFHGRIIATQPTRDLTSIVLLDAARLQNEEYNRWMSKPKRNEMSDPSKNFSGEGSAYSLKTPYYTEEEVHDTMQLFEVYPYGNSVVIKDGVEFRMRDSGHILGAAMFEIWMKNPAGRIRKFVFSGDLGQPGQRIIKDPDLVREADYVVTESTYGDRLHRSKDETVLEFLAVLKDAQSNQGTVIIPSFAIERTQEIIYELNLFVENRLLSGVPVYLDSPMAIKALEVFKRYPSFYDEDARRLIEKGDDPFMFPGLHLIETYDESKRLVDKRGCIIIAGSGMCTGGRVVDHLINNVANSKTHIIFVGYQVQGTLGRKILDGAPTVRIKGNTYDVRAKVHTLGGFSAHADERDLRYWLRSFGHSPKMIFVVHGEESIAKAFSENMHQELNIDTYVPSMNEIIEIE